MNILNDRDKRHKGRDEYGQRMVDQKRRKSEKENRVEGIMEGGKGRTERSGGREKALREK